MKKILIKVAAITLIVGGLAFNFGLLSSNNNSGDLSLKGLTMISAAQAEDDGTGRWIINFVSPSHVICYNGGVYCCPGWDC